MNARVVLALCLAAAAAGCERQAHDMYQQPRYDAQAPGPLFADGRSARTPPAGAVPAFAGSAAESSGGRLGAVSPVAEAGTALPLDDDGQPLSGPDAAGPQAPKDNPRRTTLTLLQRGQTQYAIYCQPCHGATGAGDGMVVQRGFPAPPSYHQRKLRQASDGHLYTVIRNGYGVMYAYGDRVTEDDRWAIVAYIRALQLSQHARRDALPAQDQARLDALPRNRDARR